jgi:hypothetical protein
VLWDWLLEYPLGPEHDCGRFGPFLGSSGEADRPVAFYHHNLARPFPRHHRANREALALLLSALNLNLEWFPGKFQIDTKIRFVYPVAIVPYDSVHVFPLEVPPGPAPKTYCSESF